MAAAAKSGHGRARPVKWLLRTQLQRSNLLWKRLPGSAGSESSAEQIGTPRTGAASNQKNRAYLLQWKLAHPYVQNDSIRDILREIGFDVEIDPHHVLPEHIQDILEYLHGKFGQSAAPPKRLRRNYVDLNCFNDQRPLDHAENLLELLLLALKQAFNLETGESPGMLV